MTIIIEHRLYSSETCTKAQKLREEGIEPPTAGTGIQRSTTELFPLVSTSRLYRKHLAQIKIIDIAVALI